MNKLVLLLVCGFSFWCSSIAGASSLTDVTQAPSCHHCGMDRGMFSHSRMLINYADGTSVAVCSIHCTATEMHGNNGKKVSSLKVADYTTKQLMDVNAATWVIGGSKRGVMTAMPKWAFYKAEDARKFVEEDGGSVSTFSQAMDAAIKEVKEQADESKKVEDKMRHETH